MVAWWSPDPHECRTRGPRWTRCSLLGKATTGDRRGPLQRRYRLTAVALLDLPDELMYATVAAAAQDDQVVGLFLAASVRVGAVVSVNLSSGVA